MARLNKPLGETSYQVDAAAAPCVEAVGCIFVTFTHIVHGRCFEEAQVAYIKSENQEWPISGFSGVPAAAVADCIALLCHPLPVT